MPDIITITGVVGTIPNHTRTATDLHITSFRLASTHRRFDSEQKQWVDGETNWFTVTAFRGLAKNVAASIDKGQRVVVTGRLRMRPWQKDERSGINVEIDADAVGHDLAWGTTTFTRSISSARREDGADPASESPSETEHGADAGSDAWASPPASVEVETPF